jgi:aminoglycoside phosphotransferase (APT) family kinase protein
VVDRPPGRAARHGPLTVLTDIELDRVAAYLRSVGVPLAGPLAAEQIAGGRSNLTYRLDDGRDRWVLRTPPRAGRTQSAHDVAREYRVTSALAGTDVPVAPAVALCEDESLLGVPFTVTGFVTGRAIRTRTELAELDDAELAAVMSSLTSTLASLHRVDHVAVGLGTFGRPDGYAVRQLRRWRGQWEVVGAPGPAALAASCFDALEAQVPSQGSVGIVHGDYRLDNTLVTLEPRPAVLAVVDWELSTIGDPVADVAMMCAYRDRAMDLVFGEPSAWTSDRLPDVDAMAASYVAADGVPLEHWEFHLALAHVKIAVIAAGIDHRFRAGAGSGPGFETSGQAVEPFLQQAARVLAGSGLG